MAKYFQIPAWRLWLALFFILISASFPAVALAAGNSQIIWVISDVHHFSPTLFDQGKKFDEMQVEAGGLELRYSLERLQALVTQIEQEQPDALLVTGDLTLNGELQSMQELADTFKTIEQLGTSVFVIPGNHDISNPWASSFIGEDTIRVTQTLPEDFQTMFADYGYNDAISTDPNSLSYIANFSEQWQLYMLDSNVYSKTAGLYAPKSHGLLKPKTLTWLEKEMLMQNSNQKKALVAVHHNSLSHFSSLDEGNTLDNADALQNLLSKFKLPVTLSGHIHAQHIAQANVSDNFTLTDIATGAFGSYPNRIGVITLNPQNFSYHTTQLDMATWVHSTQQTDPNLLNYDSYSQNIMANSSRLAAEQAIIGEHAYSAEEAEAVKELFSLMNQAVFAGSINKVWPKLAEDYQALLSDMSTYGNKFFDAYLEDILQMQKQTHQSLELSW